MKIIYQDSKYKYGFHIRKYKTFTETFEKVPSHLTAFQIYVGNGRSFNLPEVDVKDICNARYIKRDRYFCIHGSLILNPCGSVEPNDEELSSKTERMKKLLTAELDIGAGLGGGIVLHIGSCKNREIGISRIVETLNDVLTRKTRASKDLANELQISETDFISQRLVILENCAGEGTKIGKNLDELSQILNMLDGKVKNQVTICIDTAHDFGAGGYRWGKPEQVLKFYKDFDEKIGLDKLEMFHLNDSKVEFNSKKDRHETLGDGYIFRGGMDGLKEFFLQARKHNKPMIGEPPKDAEPPIQLTEWAKVINLLNDSEHPIEIEKSK